MTRWPRGEADIEVLLAERQLQAVTGAQADGTALVARAERTLTTSRDVVERDPDSAFVLAYDAARCAGTALLAQQGLRPTSKGGHYALELALRAQFGLDSGRSAICAGVVTSSSTRSCPTRRLI